MHDAHDILTIIFVSTISKKNIILAFLYQVSSEIYKFAACIQIYHYWPQWYNNATVLQESNSFSATHYFRRIK